MDTSVIGEVAAKAMERLGDEFGEDVQLVAVGLVVIADHGDETFTRVFSNLDRYFEQVGLFAVASEVVSDGDRDEDDDDE